MVPMRKHLKAGVHALVSLVFCADVLAVAPDSSTSRYQAIPDRNAFGLTPPAPKDSALPPPPSIPKLILTGITTILGNKRALMKAVPTAGVPGQAAKEESLILTEGQRQGTVEVLNIDEQAGSVRVNNSGSIMTLTFEKDGAKLTNTPPPAATPSRLPYPTNATAMSPLSVPTALPTRGGTRHRGSPNVQGPGQTPGVTNPVGEVGSPSAPPLVTPAPASLPPGLTPEEQAIVLQLQQQAAAQGGTTAPTQAIAPGTLLPTPQTPVLPQ